MSTCEGRYRVERERANKESDVLSYIVGPGVDHVLWMYTGPEAVVELCERAFQAGLIATKKPGDLGSEMCRCGNPGSDRDSGGMTGCFCTGCWVQNFDRAWKSGRTLLRPPSGEGLEDPERPYGGATATEPKKPGSLGSGICRCGEPGFDKRTAIQWGCFCNKCWSKEPGSKEPASKV